MTHAILFYSIEVRYNFFLNVFIRGGYTLQIPNDIISTNIHSFLHMSFYYFFLHFISALLYFNLMEIKEEMVAYHKDQQSFYL